MDSRKTPAAKETRGSTKAQRRRYLANLLLLVLLLLGTLVWVKRHLESYVVGGLFIGGVLSLWGIWEIVHTALKWGAEEELKRLPSRVLGSAQSTEYLFLGLLVVAFLHLFTSSIYVQYEAVGGGAAQYKVRVSYQTNQQPYLPDLTASSYDRIAGRPFFFRWRSVPLRLQVVEPRGFAPEEILFRPWSRLYFRVPVDFAPKKIHVLRLVPGPKLWQNLPESGGRVQTRYDLLLTWNHQTNTVSDLRRRVVCVGAAEDDMEWALGRENKDTRATEFDALLDLVHVPLANRKDQLHGWESKAACAITQDLADGVEVRVQVLRAHDGRVFFEGAVAIDPARQVQNLLMEVP